MPWFSNPHIDENQDLEIGIGTGTTNRPEYPCYQFWEYGYFAWIYKKNEIAVGKTVAITGIKFECDATDSPQIMANQTLSLGQVNSAEFGVNVRNNMTQNPAAGWATNNIQVVKSGFTWSVTSNLQRFYEINFDTPYYYNPNDTTYPHLLVYWINEANNYNNGSTSPWAECFTDGTFRSYYDYQDNSLPPATDAGTRASNGTPNIQLIIN